MSDLTLYFEDGEPSKEDENYIWKPILRTGSWKYRPGADGTPVKSSFSIVKGYSHNLSDEIGLQDLVDSFNDGAVQHVTVPKSHDDKPDENTGYIKKLEIKEDDKNPGQFVLNAAHEFTDGDVKKKVLDGSIANNSCNIVSNHINKETGKMYNWAIKHSSLTNHPWIEGMASFEDEDDSTNYLFFDNNKEVSMNFMSEFVNTLIDKIKEITTQNKDISYNENSGRNEENLSEPVTTGGLNMPIKGFENLGLSDDALTSIETAIKTAVDSAVNAKNDEFEAKLSEKESLISSQNEELANFRELNKENEVDSYISELNELGLDQAPGFLKEVRNILLSDTGEQSFNFSEDGNSESLSVTNIVKKLVDALPRNEENNIKLSEQGEFVPNKERPPFEPGKKTDAERAAEAREFLGVS